MTLEAAVQNVMKNVYGYASPEMRRVHEEELRRRLLAGETVRTAKADFTIHAGGGYPRKLG